MEYPASRNLREGNHLEAKRAKGGVPESTWETYSAFANTNGGLIILGASEEKDGTIVYSGVMNPDQLVKKFWDAVNNPSKVSANILTADAVRVDEVNGCSIVCIEVPRAERHVKPIYIRGNRETGTYRRNGEGDYHCSPDEILAMIRDASNTPLDDAVLAEFSLKALSEESVSRYRSNLAAVRPNHPWLNLEYEEFLVKLNAAGRLAGDTELHPTRAGLLMFGFENEIVKEYTNYFLDYREASTKARWSDRIVSNDGTWSGNIFDFWSEALPRLSSSLKRPFALGNDLRRIEDTEMHAAIREAFVNALIHADYHGRRGIVALRHEGRIEVSNPGTSLVALDVVKAGGVSEARNPTLMKMFGLISACEHVGSGFDVMRNAAEAAGAIPPEIKESFDPDRVEVTLHVGQLAVLYPGEGVFPSENLMPGFNYVYDPPRSESQRENSATPPLPGALPIGISRSALSHDLTKIVEMARDQGSFTRKDVEKILGCGATKAKGLIGDLLDLGLINIEGTARGTRYLLS